MKAKQLRFRIADTLLQACPTARHYPPPMFSQFGNAC